MHSLATTAAFFLLSLGCLASPAPYHKSFSAHQAPAISELVKTSNYMEISSKKATGSAAGLSAARFQKYGSESLRDLGIEKEWAGKISFGGEDFFVIIDTGSSDTWLAQTGFQCLDINGEKISQADCKFGPLYNGTFDEGKIKDENFNISYGDGTFVTGNMGYSDVTIAGIKVTKQEVALADKAHWDGDGVTSGLLGLAYSAITSAFDGTDPSLDNFNITGTAPGGQQPYSPIVQSMIAQGLGEPLFSLAIQRSANTNAGGYIAFGGLPPVSVDPAAFVSTPILIHKSYGYPTPFAGNRTVYTIAPDAYVYENEKGVVTNHAINVDAIVDSGSTLLYVPTAVYYGYIASFDQAPIIKHGYPHCPCNATAPYLGIKIAGTVFNISSADLILPYSGFTSDTTAVKYCMIGVSEARGGLPIFGDVFLKNVVAVFDIGASVMRFAQHIY